MGNEFKHLERDGKSYLANVSEELTPNDIYICTYISGSVWCLMWVVHYYCIRLINKKNFFYKISQIHCITRCKPYLLGHNWQQCRNLCHIIIKKQKLNAFIHEVESPLLGTNEPFNDFIIKICYTRDKVVSFNGKRKLTQTILLLLYIRLINGRPLKNSSHSSEHRQSGN